MRNAAEEYDIGQDRRDQMLRLVSKGFYRELVNYGVKREEIVRVASHLLDNIMNQQVTREPGSEYYDNLFTIRDIEDNWATEKQIKVKDVSLRPLDSGLLGKVAGWLDKPGISGLFVPRFPEDPAELEKRLLESPANFYFAIHQNGRPVGIIGGENLDATSDKLEMKKLVGDPKSRGLGVGKRATFAFLYFAFKIMGVHKVYVHSKDINIRNINLNSRFGFVLEGIFLEDSKSGDEYQDVVRMALFKPFWLQIFSGDAR